MEQITAESEESGIKNLKAWFSVGKESHPLWVWDEVFGFGMEWEFNRQIREVSAIIWTLYHSVVIKRELRGMGGGG